MKIASINQNHQATKTGRKVGTLAGAGVGTAIVIKDRKDVFNRLTALGEEKLKQVADEASKTKLQETLTKNAKKGTIAAGAAVIAGALVAGRLIGGLIGKIVDAHNAKKQAKQI